jgi:4-amino-4-deoxy-L-arabinose transferase-like glycosyltransferase
MSVRVQWLLHGLMLLGCTAIYVGGFSNGHNWGGDFSAYIMQAVSIVEGSSAEFIERNAFTVEGSSYAMGPITYPWGFPLLLAPVYALFGMNLLAFKLVGLVCYLLFLTTLQLGLRHYLSVTERMVAVAFFAFNPNLLWFGDNILSDFPFLLFSTVALFMLDAVSKGRYWWGQREDMVVLGLVIGAAFLVRTNGILLLPVLAFALVWQSRRLLAALTAWPALLSFAMLVLGVMSWLPDAQSSHFNELDAVSWDSIRRNLDYYAWLIQDMFILYEYPGFAAQAYWVSLMLVCLGLTMGAVSSLPLLLYALLTLGLFVVWPHLQGLRFLYPLLPVFVLYAVMGLRVLAPLLAPLRVSHMSAVLPLLALFFWVGMEQTHRQWQNGQFMPVDGPYMPDAQEVFAFIREQTPPDAVVVFQKPRVLRLMTDRDSVMHNSHNSFSVFDYLLLDLVYRGDQIPVESMPGNLEAHPGQLVFENSRFQLYKFDNTKGRRE